MIISDRWNTYVKMTSKNNWQRVAWWRNELSVVLKTTRSVVRLLVESRLRNYSGQVIHPCVAFITGSIARSASLPVFNLLRGRFWGFSPRRGNTLHQWGGGEIRHGGGDRRSPPPCQISPPSVQRPYPLRDFHIICRVCTPFQDALAVKTWLDLLEGLWSYGGFQLRGSGFPQIFSAP